MGELRVGLIGYGYAGHTFHAPLLRATPGLVLAAVASSDAAKVHAALGEGVAVLTPEALVARDDLDLVVIATPNDRHHPLAREALRAGRHVVVDKPFALDVAQAQELVTLAQDRQRVLSVFHNRRWDSDFLTLQQAMRDGLVGRPVELIACFDRYRPEVRARWREGDVPGGGLWMDLGPHLVDQALCLFGTPQAITLDLGRLRDGAQADDWFCALLRWADGRRALLQARTLAARPGPRFLLHGTAASLGIDGLDPQEDRLKAGATPAQITAADWGRDERRASLWPGAASPQPAVPLPLQAGRYPAYYAALRDAILGRGPVPVPATDALAVQQWLEAGQRSARERREAALPT